VPGHDLSPLNQHDRSGFDAQTETPGYTPEVITYEDFDKVDVRVGRIVQVDDFPEARKPAYKLLIDFGAEIGVKKSSAQAKALYSKEALLGRLILGVVNFPPKQIGPFMSEVLTLGVPDGTGHVVLVGPEREAPLGGRLF
jgi:tRNA-binding protein